MTIYRNWEFDFHRCSVRNTKPARAVVPFNLEWLNGNTAASALVLFYTLPNS
jgi:hypothetical protein